MQRPSQNELNSTKSFVLREIARYFFKLGFRGYNGTQGVLTRMEQDLAGTWVAATRFSESLRALESLPGPKTFQLALFLAFERGRTAGVARLGSAVAAFSLIAPSMIVLILLGVSRSAWKEWAWSQSFLIGIQAATVGIVMTSLPALSKSTHANDEYLRIAKWLFALFGFIVALLKPSLEPLAIVICGVLALAPTRTRLYGATLIAVPTALVGISFFEIQLTLFSTAVKAGALAFGGSVAMLPILGGEFVDRLQWLTHTELLEALSLSLLTPAPLLITVTYIGTLIGGIPGAVTATFGVLLVPFINMTTWFPTHGKRLSESLQWRRFIFGAITAIIGSLCASIIKMFEPFVLSGLETEILRLDRPLATMLVWIILVPTAYYLTAKKKQPGWAVLIGSGLAAYASLRWF